MALRVLLADESVTIKKVFQLALQDYGVEVLSVHVGVDVIPVATKFKPDIVFADVLLQKKNGYEVCAELKAHAELGHAPVILIWSGFMELDEAKFKACGADGHLEKPFDTEGLRQIVQKFVPKTGSQELSEYLAFPTLPEFDEPKKSPAPAAAPPEMPEPTSVGPAPSEPSSSWNMESFAPVEDAMPLQVVQDEDDEESTGDDFVEMNLSQEEPPPMPRSAPEVEEESESQWISKTLTNFKLDRAKIEAEDEVSYQVPEEKIDASSILKNSDVRKSQQTATPPPLNQRIQQAKQTLPNVESVDEDDIELDLGPEETKSSPAYSELNEKQMEAIVRREAREIIEKVVWEVVPEIATQIIEREIKKLLKEKDETAP